VRMLLLGAPGSGKSTQGQRLGEELGLPHIATGDLIRDHIARGTEFGKKVEAAIAAGNFAADEDIAYWVGKRLADPDCAGGYMLDGYPRDIKQAKAFDAAATDKRAFDFVADLAISDEAAAQRLAGRLICPRCGRTYQKQSNPPRRDGICDQDDETLTRRPDDQPDAVRHRLDVYEKLTVPLREYYSTQGILRDIDATGSPDTVFQRLAAAARPFASGHKNARLRV